MLLTSKVLDFRTPNAREAYKRLLKDHPGIITTQYHTLWEASETHFLLIVVEQVPELPYQNTSFGSYPPGIV